jgi:hypothetical protein
MHHDLVDVQHCSELLPARVVGPSPPAGRHSIASNTHRAERATTQPDTVRADGATARVSAPSVARREGRGQRAPTERSRCPARSILRHGPRFAALEPRVAPHERQPSSPSRPSADVSRSYRASTSPSARNGRTLPLGTSYTRPYDITTPREEADDAQRRTCRHTAVSSSSPDRIRVASVTRKRRVRLGSRPPGPSLWSPIIDHTTGCGATDGCVSRAPSAAS